MNLYKLHTNPESLYGYKKATERVPDIAWETHKRNHDKLRELEDTWTKSAQYSYWYARDILKNRFPKGEDTIATNDVASFLYAVFVLRPLGIIGFPKGEDAIATNAEYSYLYAKSVLEGKFPKGEDAIATNAEYSYRYARVILEDRFPKGEDAIRGSEYQESYEELFGVKL
jgi:lambda repressor-like predicted transcriptional regulator